MKYYVLLLLILYVVSIFKQNVYTVTCKHPKANESKIEKK